MRATVLLSSLAMTATAAACGRGPSSGPSSSPSGRAVVPAAGLLLQAQAALAHVSGVRIEGGIVQTDGSGTDSLDVDATSVGTTGTSEGTLDLEGPGLGFTGSTRFVVVGSTTWVDGTGDFWKSYFGPQTPTVVRLEDKVLAKLREHWVELLPQSTETMYTDALGLSEPRAFVSGKLSGLKGTLTNAGNQTVSGVSGVQITASTGGTIVLAGSGAALPIELSATASTSGSFRLHLAVSYPTGVTIVAPAHFVLLSSVLKATAQT